MMEAFMDAVFRLDAFLLLWIQAHLRHPLLNPVMLAITHLGDAGIFWILVTLALLAFRKTRKIGAACAISMIVGLVATNLILKNWIARIRPYEVIDGLNLMIERQRDFSFPSGHTTNSFAAACVIFGMAPRRYGVPALILAALISLSRLYVGVHYPTDVLAGALIGCLAAWAGRRAVCACSQRNDS